MTMDPDVSRPRLQTCPCCGLAQRVAEPAAAERACCGRCDTTLRSHGGRQRSNSRAAAVAIAALILYPLAVSLPILKVEKLGLRHESSILEGIGQLLTDGHLGVGLVVLACSVILPMFKLLALVVLSLGAPWLRSRHRALTYHVIEWTGRYGMLDVLLVAILVAVLKLGDLVTVSAGPGAMAFTGLVVLSLIAAAVFDPHALWEGQDA